MNKPKPKVELPKDTPAGGSRKPAPPSDGQPQQGPPPTAPPPTSSSKKSSPSKNPNQQTKMDLD